MDWQRSNGHVWANASTHIFFLVCAVAGLESLIDDIQILSLQDYFDANALERLEDDDDDNWSEPASSVVEDLALDF